MAGYIRAGGPHKVEISLLLLCSLFMKVFNHSRSATSVKAYRPKTAGQTEPTERERERERERVRETEKKREREREKAREREREREEEDSWS
jgi:hypothetical protein